MKEKLQEYETGWRTKWVERQNADLTEALTLIAAPIRSDGTWNRDRRACQILAEEALKKQGVIFNTLAPHRPPRTAMSRAVEIDASHKFKP